MKTTFFLLLFLNGFVYSQKQIDISIITVVGKPAVGNSNSIELKFPKIEGGAAAAVINDSLRNYLKSFFYNDLGCTTEQCLEKAIQIGLRKIEYTTCTSDSTLSFIMSFTLQNGKTDIEWEDYMTYSKTTGKQLELYDLFPQLSEVDFDNYLHYKIIDFEVSINQRISEKHSQGVISDSDYKVLSKFSKYPFYVVSYYDFILCKTSLCIKTRSNVPKRLSEHFKISFTIDTQETIQDLSNESEDTWMEYLRMH